MLRAGFHRTIKLSLLLGLAVCVGSINAAEPKPETVSQRLLKAKSANLDPELRVLAIDSLAGVSKEEESDNKVIEGLLDIVKSTNDIFVRISAIDALGKLQVNVTKDDKAKTKFLDPFLAILKNKDEHVKVRVAVANVFKQTLDKNKLADTDQVFKPAILPVASNKADPTLLRVVCIQAIGEFGKAENIAILADLLIEEDPQIRTATVDAILTLMSKATEVQVPVPVVNKLLDVMRDEKADIVLRVAVMKLMAQLVRENNTTAKNEAFPYFVKIIEKGNDDVLTLAGVESLGIVGNAEAVPPLLTAYKNYFDKTKPDNPKDVPTRKAVVKSLRSVLSTQNEAKNPDMKAVKAVVAQLVAVLDDDGSPDVKGSAVFALRYLYPKKYESEHKEAVSALISLLKDNRDDAWKKKINDTLESITNASPGADYDRWMDYFSKRYPKK